MYRLSSLKPRLRAAGIHLACSALVAGLASLLVFKLWYPSPFAAIAGGTHLFLLLMSVDVVMGPALTAVAASANKPKPELVRDLAVIVVLQLAAFSYGLYTMALARPVAVAYEIDLFRVVAAADIEPDTLREAPVALRELSWAGPRVLAAVKPTNPDEQARSIELGLAGIHLSSQPRYWREYPAHADAAWRAARPVSALLTKYPGAAADLARIAAAAGEHAQALRFLPLQVRRADWVAVLHKRDARIVGYLPLDGFF